MSLKTSDMESDIYSLKTSDMYSFAGIPSRIFQEISLVTEEDLGNS